MSSSIEVLNNLPDVNFVDKDVDTLLADMIAEYQNAYYDATGEKKILASGDPVRIWIYAQALRIYTAYQLIDRAAKYNLLKYSSGDYLENLGARIGVTRKKATSATVTQKFSLAEKQPVTVVIPKGTRVSASGNVFFTTTDTAEIKAGDTEVEVNAECTEVGTIGNDFIADEVTTLVDPIPFITSTTNTEKSQGGADEESDDSLRERIFLKPESFSVAGSKNAYEYYAKEYSQTVEDVSVTSPSPGKVDIRFILTNGEIPNSSMIKGMEDYLSDAERRPLTDQLTVAAPGQVNYEINLTYYIRASESNRSQTIQAAVENAVSDFKLWQKSKIGRDINPSELIARIIKAGAKRVGITAPIFTELTDIQVAKEGTVTVTYGGLEDE